MDQPPLFKWRHFAGEIIVCGVRWYLRYALNLLYLSTSFLWLEAVAGIRGGKSSHALRRHTRCTWRYRDGARNVDNTAIRRTLGPWRPCRSVTYDNTRAKSLEEIQ